MKTRFVTVIGVVMSAAYLALCEGADAQKVSCAARSSSEGKRVEEAGFVAIGGIEQWVTVRGEDSQQPHSAARSRRSRNRVLGVCGRVCALRGELHGRAVGSARRGLHLRALRTGYARGDAGSHHA